MKSMQRNAWTKLPCIQRDLSISDEALPQKPKTFMTTTTKSTCPSPIEESVQSKDIIVICIPLLFLPNQQGGPTFNVNLSTIPLLGTSRLVRRKWKNYFAQRNVFYISK
jgi:hypothetical protein